MNSSYRTTKNAVLLVQGYYGYGNRGDELLLLGLLRKLSLLPAEYSYQHVCIRVADAQRVQDWLDRHAMDLPFELVLDDTSRRRDVVGVLQLLYRYRNADILWGAGEVLSERRGFFHGGWNYAVQYFPWVLRGKHCIVGGLETPKRMYQKILYRLLVSRARAVVLRDATSYKTATHYTNKATLDQDWGERYLHTHIKQTQALPMVQNAQGKSTALRSPYILLNLHPSISAKEYREALTSFVQSSIRKNPDIQRVYLPCGAEDMNHWDTCLQLVPDCLVYQRETHTVEDTYTLFAQALHAWGSRLHFLLTAKAANTPYTPYAYAEKIRKLLE